MHLPGGYFAIGKPCGEGAGDTFMLRRAGRRRYEEQAVAEADRIARHSQPRRVDPRRQLGLDQPAVERLFPTMVRAHQPFARAVLGIAHRIAGVNADITQRV